MRTVIGIDPGLSGGICVLTGDKHTLYPMPVYGGAINPYILVEIIQNYSPCILFVEKAHAMPSQGTKSMFKFGRNFGIVEGVAAALRQPMKIIAARTWQRVMHQGVDMSLPPKKKSLMAANRLAPEERFLATRRSWKPSDGLVDAFLIAKYGAGSGLVAPSE